MVVMVMIVMVMIIVMVVMVVMIVMPFTSTFHAILSTSSHHLFSTTIVHASTFIFVACAIVKMQFDGSAIVLTLIYIFDLLAARVGAVLVKDHRIVSTGDV